MSSNSSRFVKSMLVFSTIVASSFFNPVLLSANEPELVELTLMIRSAPVVADSIPSPDGEDAIGFVLDGNPAGGVGVGVSYNFGPDLEGYYNGSDASYVTRGGTISAAIYVKGHVLPAHGFINLQRSLILDTTPSFATYESSEDSLEPVDDDYSEYATDYLIFIHGLFELHSR